MIKILPDTRIPSESTGARAQRNLCKDITSVIFSPSTTAHKSIMTFQNFIHDGINIKLYMSEKIHKITSPRMCGRTHSLRFSNLFPLAISKALPFNKQNAPGDTDGTVLWLRGSLESMALSHKRPLYHCQFSLGLASSVTIHLTTKRGITTTPLSYAAPPRPCHHDANLPNLNPTRARETGDSTVQSYLVCTRKQFQVTIHGFDQHFL